MILDYKKLLECKWDNSFISVYNSDNSIFITVFDLIIDEFKYEKLYLNFINIKDEWASYWDDYKNEWIDHSSKISPIGNKITVFNAKKAGENISVSIGGNHILGFSRWGFYSEKVEISITN